MTRELREAAWAVANDFVGDIRATSTYSQLCEVAHELVEANFIAGARWAFERAAKELQRFVVNERIPPTDEYTHAILMCAYLAVRDLASEPGGENADGGGSET